MSRFAKLFLLTIISTMPALDARAEKGQSLPTSARARQLGDIAQKSNPSIHALRSRIHALSAVVEKASAWADPRVGLEYSNMPVDAWIPGKHAMSGIQLKFQQRFYWPGKRALRKAVAEGKVREAKHSLAERRVQLRALVADAYYRLALVRQLREVTRDHVRLTAQFIDVVRIKYEVGKAGQHELVRLQVLAAKLRDDVKAFDRDEQALTSAINATLHRPASVKIETPKKITPTAAPTDEKALLERVRKNRPLLKRYVEIAKTRRLAARQATREGYPDLTASVGYRIRLKSGSDPGTNFIGFGLSMPIPLSREKRWGSEKRKNIQLAREAEYRGAALIDSVRAKLGRVLANWRRAAQKATTYRKKLMPLAHRALDSTYAAYQVGRADFASLFQAQLQLLDFEKAIRHAEAAAAAARVETERLIGGRLQTKEKEE